MSKPVTKKPIAGTHQHKTGIPGSRTEVEKGEGKIHDHKTGTKAGKSHKTKKIPMA
jgi:hypothetical protein